MGVVAVRWLVREARARRSWIYASWDKKPLGLGGDLNPREVPQRTKIRHKKLITKMSLNKGNILRVITSDDLVIHVKKKKGPTTRWHVDKESWIMSAGRKASSYDHISKMLKPSLRSLLKAKKRVTKVTNHTLRDRIPKWWTHVNILTQLTIKKGILHIKLRDRPLPNRSHSKKSVNSGHMNNRSKKSHHNHDLAPIENHDQQDEPYSTQENHHSES
jgi:hypothetical protein